MNSTHETLTVERITQLEAFCPEWCSHKGKHDWRQDATGAFSARHRAEFGAGDFVAVSVAITVDVFGRIEGIETDVRTAPAVYAARNLREAADDPLEQSRALMDAASFTLAVLSVGIHSGKAGKLAG
ncbi:MAG: hypothetical protein PHU75_09005 [Candidatus Nanopelagicales bacterium]|nr:hypothetical protein [Candidatus Nanopelagicales bacterium]